AVAKACWACSEKSVGCRMVRMASMADPPLRGRATLRVRISKKCARERQRVILAEKSGKNASRIARVLGGSVTAAERGVRKRLALRACFEAVLGDQPVQGTAADAEYSSGLDLVSLVLL